MGAFYIFVFINVNLIAVDKYFIIIESDIWSNELSITIWI